MYCNEETMAVTSPKTNKKGKTEMKVGLITVSSRIIKDFVKKANFAHYEYCQLYKPDGMSAKGILGSGGACDEVWDDDYAEKRLLSEGNDLYLVFGQKGVDEERLLIRMKDGETFYINESTRNSEYKVLMLGVLDKCDIKALRPLYNKLYLDRWAKNYKQDAVPSSVVGIHDEFTRLAQNIYNTAIRCDFPGVEKPRNVNGAALVLLNLRLRILKDGTLVFD